MSWQVEMVVMLRGLINDLDEETYTDSRLEDYLSIAAQLVLNQVSFDYTYTVDVSEKEISPDPTSVSDNAFINLVSLKAACIIVTGEYKSQAAKTVSFRNAQTALDTKGAADAKKDLMKSVCAAYEQEKEQFMMGNRTPGRIITGPISHPDFCPYWQEGQHRR
jgi:hypothetical protein